MEKNTARPDGVHNLICLYPQDWQTRSYAQMEQTDGYGAQVDEKSLQTYYVGYNLSSEIFGDQVVREAISSAIDKDAVVDNIYGGLFDKADTFFSRDLPYCDVEQTVYGFDLDHANQILDEAGYVDTDGDGIREKDGVKLSAAFMYQTGTASDDNMVVYICDQASKIGIELTPQSAQMMDWYAMIQSGDYGLTIFKTQGGYYDPATRRLQSSLAAHRQRSHFCFRGPFTGSAAS